MCKSLMCPSNSVNLGNFFPQYLHLSFGASFAELVNTVIFVGVFSLSPRSLICCFCALNCPPVKSSLCFSFFFSFSVFISLPRDLNLNCTAILHQPLCIEIINLLLSGSWLVGCHCFGSIRVDRWFARNWVLTGG